MLQDLRGYLHLRGALSPEELQAARVAADALMLGHDAGDGDELPEIFRTGLHQKVLALEQRKGPHQVYGFCWDRSLEKIAFHRATWYAVQACHQPPTRVVLPAAHSCV